MAVTAKGGTLGAGVELTGSPLNSPAARAALQVLLDREEGDIEHDVANYTVYPVVSIGVSYKF